LPTVIVYGVDHFVAEKLVRVLLSKDLNVIGVGSFVSGLGDLENFSYMTDVSEIETKFICVFDFVGSELVWKKAEQIGAKVTVISCDDEKRERSLRENLKNFTGNWRMVRAYNVYGPGMKLTGFLAEAMMQAVKNQNLLLPAREEKFRLLAVDDLVEAIMRATFLSGTEREEYLIMGEESDSVAMAEVLIDEAKMTRLKVKEENVEVKKESEEEVVENWEKLRWQPEISFAKGVGETLRSFFSRVDEENRKGGGREEVEVKTGWRKMEVVVEEDSPESKVESRKSKVKSRKSKVESQKLQVASHKKTEEILVVRNSNMRPGSSSFEEEKEGVKEAEKVERTEEREKKKKIGGWWKWLLGGVVIVCLTVPIKWGVETFSIYKNVTKVKGMIEVREYKQASELAEKSIKKVKKLDRRVSDWGLNKREWGRNYQAMLRITENILDLEIKGASLAGNLEKMSDFILKGGELDWDKDFLSLKNDLIEVSGKLGVLQARLKGDWSWLPPRWKSWPQKGNTLLAEAKEKIDLGVNGMEILPDFLGVGGKRKEYMVLLQNEMELRPGGGFIGSFGILSFEEGKLLNFEVKDVYEADGQLKGHVEPPEEIKKYLNEAGWYMRDANWDVDFVTAGDKIAWFLKKEIGREVDGVIGINLAVAKKLLEVIGEVYVPDFEEKVNEANLYEQAEFWSERNFFPGSNQKASFLGGLSRQLFEEVKDLSTEEMLSLSAGLLDLLERNEIQLAINDEKVAERVGELGWNGAMWEGTCGVDRCLADYLYIVEANVGVNKANYFLYRNIEQMVEVSERSISRVLKINYENIAKSNDWPGGDYKNYMRIYLPLNVNLAQVALIDGNNEASRKVYSLEELKISQVGDKKEVGLLMTVPVGEKRIVEVRYSTAIDLTGTDKFSYLSYVQKQSGFGDTGLVTLVSIPAGWQPLQVEPVASMVGGKILFNQKLERDIKMGVELSK